MLARMEAKEKKRPKRVREKWFLYILKCADASLYTGIAKDVQKRFQMHSKGKGARYTRTRRPLEIVYEEPCRSRTHALIREYAVKSLPQSKKINLLESFSKSL